ncbi:hypothetical protein G6F68_018275 [Rhizopus microsporus]|nr:hypothetical protein G6F68_018275 [Rhizopus microsporus]
MARRGVRARPVTTQQQRAHRMMVPAQHLPLCACHPLQLRKCTERGGCSRVDPLHHLGLTEARAQYDFHVAIVGEHDVSLREQLAQHRLGISAPALPEPGPEIAVEGDPDTGLHCAPCSSAGQS